VAGSADGTPNAEPEATGEPAGKEVSIGAWACGVPTTTKDCAIGDWDCMTGVLAAPKDCITGLAAPKDCITGLPVPIDCITGVFVGVGAAWTSWGALAFDSTPD